MNSNPVASVSIASMLAAWAAQTPDAAAICAPARDPLTYGTLWSTVQDRSRQLRGLGVAQTDRLAIVLPNGPEMAVAFLSAACSCAAAPLNPAYREPDLELFFADLRPRAVLVESGSSLPAVAVALARGIPVLELLSLRDHPAGALELLARPSSEDGAGLTPVEKVSRPAAAAPLPSAIQTVDSLTARTNDVALVLYTSGTTSRPKMVPLTHANLCTSALTIARTLRLDARDRCLNVLPLFHIHGLVAALLASLAAGGSVCCTGGFAADAFFEWLDSCRPTWYTAVPTIHQAIWQSASRRDRSSLSTSLRLIRSSSAPLPPRVMAGLEEAFGVPVIEAYGMTEAAHQIASNPLPPAQRKPSSVGLATGTMVTILDHRGRSLPVGETGEVAVRGANVLSGYLDNPAGNASAFVNGWFRTGDLGQLDADGYLFLRGRLKELINRGGEKVSPVLVDAAFVEHASVAQAVTFGVPHPTLGEDVATAVVLRPGHKASEEGLRQFAFDHLEPHSVPTRVLIVADIPKGPTGKLQRRGLAELFSGLLLPPYVAPRDPVEQTVAALWEELLAVPQVGAHDNFFALGGDSLQAARLVNRLRAAFRVELPLSTMFRQPTVAAQAAQITDFLIRETEGTAPLDPGDKRGSENARS